MGQFTSKKTMVKCVLPCKKTMVKCVLPCSDCGNTTLNEYYMLEDHVWDATGMASLDGKCLCVGCVEKRLGRKLENKDFKRIFMNIHSFSTKSDRLLNRLGCADDSDVKSHQFVDEDFDAMMALIYADKGPPCLLKCRRCGVEINVAIGSPDFCDKVMGLCSLK